jgi:hypothetical protein
MFFDSIIYRLYKKQKYTYILIVTIKFMILQKNLQLIYETTIKNKGGD